MTTDAGDSPLPFHRCSPSSMDAVKPRAELITTASGQDEPVPRIAGNDRVGDTPASTEKEHSGYDSVRHTAERPRASRASIWA